MILSATGLALPRLAEELKLTSLQQGSLVSVQFLGFTPGVLLGGTLSDSFGRLKVLRFAMAGLGMATFIFSISVYYAITVLGIFLIGFFGSICQNAIVSLATAYDSKKADENNALIQVFFTVGAVITPLMLMLFMMRLNLWRVAYYIIAVLCIGMALFSLKYRDRAHTEGTSLKEAFRQYKSAFVKPIYLVSPIALFLYVGAETGLWGFAPTFFESRGYGKISGIIASVLIWVTMLLGRLLSVRLLKKIDMVKILLAHGVFAVVSLTMVIFSSHTTAIIWIALSGFACAPFYPFLTIWMTRLTGEKNSTMLAFNMAAGALGPVVMGLFTGMIVEDYGSRYITSVPSFALVLAVVILFIFRNRKAESAR